MSINGQIADFKDNLNAVLSTMSDSIDGLDTAVSGKIDRPTGGTTGQVLTKTANGEAWQSIETPDVEQADWAESDTTAKSYIKNKPQIPSIDGLATENYVDGKTENVPNHEASIDNIGGYGIGISKINGYANLIASALSNNLVFLSESIPPVAVQASEFKNWTNGWGKYDGVWKNNNLDPSNVQYQVLHPYVVQYMGASTGVWVHAQKYTKFQKYATGSAVYTDAYGTWYVYDDAIIAGKAEILDLKVALRNMDLMPAKIETSLVTRLNELGKYIENPNKNEYFNITCVDSLITVFLLGTTANSVSLEYSYDKTTWTPMTNGNSIFTTRANPTVYIRGDNATFSADFFNNYVKFQLQTGYEMYLKGNIMSLLSKNNFATMTAVSDYCFINLFSGNGIQLFADELVLPATTLGIGCYSNMFSSCPYLKSAPALPATTLASDCYVNMFLGCTSLTTAPALPATTLADRCYAGMLWGCISLTTAPALPATTLASQCYNTMFYNCSSLTTAPALPATMLANGCYSAMFKNCSSLTTAPTLPAVALPFECYVNMFNGCTSLNSIEVNFTSWGGEYFTFDWVSGVSQSGIFIKPASLPATTGTNYIPAGWTSIDK